MHGVVQRQPCFPGKIKDVLTKGTLDHLTRLVLVNAMYFKSELNLPFQRGATRDAQFRINKVSTSINKCQLRSLNEFQAWKHICQVEDVFPNCF